MAGDTNLDLSGFVQAWMEQAASVMSQVSGQTWAATLDASAGIAIVSEVVLCLSAGKGLAGNMGLRLSPSDAVRMSRQFTGMPYSDEEQLAGDDQEALVELVRQIAGLVASALKPATGEVEFLGGEPGPLTWQAVSTSRLKLRCGEQEITLELIIDSLLLEALAPKPVAQQASTVVHECVQQGNLNLLMDVELGVTLRFGQREMLLRDILDLSSGTVVELDRQVQEPVDLLLDDKVIARGEVVIVNGNYGLRVTEVASPAQRIGSIN